MEARSFTRLGWRALWRTAAILALSALLLSTPFLSTAQAQSTCDPGFALTSGGVPEADLNGDGLTCELDIANSTGAVDTLALDNVPYGADTISGTCPPGFTSIPAVVPTTDRNGNGLECTKPKPAPCQSKIGQADCTPYIIIDDQANKPN